LEARARSQIPHRLREQDLARGCERRNARTRVHRDATDLLAVELAFAGVDPCTNVDAEVTESAADRERTADGARRAVEGGKEAVAGGVDLMPAKALELAPDRRVVRAEELAPAAIA